MDNTTRTPVWPSKTCTRCGGTGEYSYNQKDGTMCYGCGGTRYMLLNKNVQAIANEYRALLKAATRPTGGDLKVGDWICVYGAEGGTYGKPFGLACETMSGRRPAGTEYAEIISLEITPGDAVKNWGSASVNGVVTHYVGRVAFEYRTSTGEVISAECSTSNLWIRRSDVDRAPFLARAEAEAAKVAAREAKKAAR